jgi:hypothetical protein
LNHRAYSLSFVQQGTELRERENQSEIDDFQGDPSARQGKKLAQ